LGKPLLGHMLDQLDHCQALDRIVVATPDQEIADYVSGRVEVFLGDEQDVLDRYYQTSKKFDAKVVVRLTADCPLIDPMLVDDVVQTFQKGKWDYLSNTLERSFPRGMDVEVFSREALERAHLEAKGVDEREHVTLYMVRHPELFSLGSYDVRLTVDTERDFKFIKKLIENLQEKEKPIRLSHMWGHVEP